MNATPRKLRFAIVGAGISGILCGKRLIDEGYDDFTIYEKGDSVGGTWRENRYPGVACDTPAHVYCYSFELNPNWSKSCAPGTELHSYLGYVADKYRVTPHVKFNTEITRCEYRDGRWHIQGSNGVEDVVDVLLCATGALHHPRIPDIPGLNTFAGTWTHSARWPENLELKDKRVGVIGAGATATQLVTEVADRVSKLSVFQRTVQWIYPWPHQTFTETEKQDFRDHPGKLKKLSDEIWAVLKFIATFVLNADSKEALEVQGACEKHLAEAVKDPVLRQKLMPNYRAGCKRLIFNTGFYEAMQLPTTELIREGIERIEPKGVRTVDGRLHELDVLVLATGFQAHQYMRPMKIIGRGGIDLDTIWKDKPYAYRTLSLPGFPNMFTMIGPGSPIGNFSLVTVAEILFDYMLPLFHKLRDGECTEINASKLATDRYYESMLDAMPGTIWKSGCQSWYLDEKGNPDTWVWSVAQFEDEFKQPDLRDYELV